MGIAEARKGGGTEKGRKRGKTGRWTVSQFGRLHPFRVSVPLRLGIKHGARLHVFLRQAAMNMPLALSSWGQKVTAVARAGVAAVAANTGEGSSSGCAAVKSAATAVVSRRVSVQTA